MPSETERGGKVHRRAEVLDKQGLGKVHEQVHEMIEMEKEELEMIKEHCFSDIETIPGPV